jgi:hypothetical protein
MIKDIRLQKTAILELQSIKDHYYTICSSLFFSLEMLEAWSPTSHSLHIWIPFLLVGFMTQDVHAWEYNETVNQLFIDFKKAYDSVRKFCTISH